MPRESVRYCSVQIDYIAAISRAAVLVGYEGREVWVPMSQIFEDDIPTERSSDPQEINIAEWFAKKEGMR